MYTRFSAHGLLQADVCECWPRWVAAQCTLLRQRASSVSDIKFCIIARAGAMSQCLASFTARRRVVAESAKASARAITYKALCSPSLWYADVLARARAELLLAHTCKVVRLEVQMS